MYRKTSQEENDGLTNLKRIMQFNS